MNGKKENLRPGQIYWLILETIALTLVSGGGSPLRPTLPIAVKTIGKLLKELHKVKIEEAKIRKTLVKLEKKEIITINEKGDDVYVQIKDNNPTVLKYSIKALLNFKIKKKKWDGRWFLVFFDVPEIQRIKRNYLRRYLKKIGFYRYQQSVYLFPYSCEEEINLIRKIVEGASYMKYIIAEKIEDEEELKRHFNL